VAYVVIPPGKSIGRHFHWDSEETYFILKGRPTLKVNGAEFEMGPAEACLMEPADRHELSNRTGEPVEFLAISGPPWTPSDTYRD
jgi:mannose-6-phosphate isomerase-like protein (cupin superfamily)